MSRNAHQGSHTNASFCGFDILGSQSSLQVILRTDRTNISGTQRR